MPRLNGSSQRLTRTSGPLLNYNLPYTLMYYIYVTSVSTNQYLVGLAQDESFGTQMDLVLINLSALKFKVNGTDAAGATLQNNTRYHITQARESGSSATLYINGELTATNTTSVGTSRTAVATMMCNGYGGIDFGNFRLDRMKAWQRLLNPAEIRAEMRSVTPIARTSLFGFWPMLPGAGNRGRDWSGNGYHWTEVGTLADEEPPPIPWELPRLFAMPDAGSGGTAYTDTGSASSTATASGADALAFPESGSAASAANASGADSLALIESGAASGAASASGADALTLLESGSATSAAAGSGADSFSGASSYSDTGGASSSASASAADSFATTESGQAVAISGASGAEALTASEAGSAASMAQAGAADVLTLIDAGGGVLVASSSAVDALTLTDAGGAVAGLFGAGADLLTLIDVGGGVLVAKCSGADALVQVVITPQDRLWTVSGDDRTFITPRDDRAFVVVRENRIFIP